MLTRHKSMTEAPQNLRQIEMPRKSTRQVSTVSYCIMFLIQYWLGKITFIAFLCLDRQNQRNLFLQKSSVWEAKQLKNKQFKASNGKPHCSLLHVISIILHHIADDVELLCHSIICRSDKGEEKPFQPGYNVLFKEIENASEPVCISSGCYEETETVTDGRW